MINTVDSTQKTLIDNALVINDAISILGLASDAAERGFTDETLLHLGMLGVRLEKLKSLIAPETV